MSVARVVGIGQAAAGDDGVALAVLDELARVGAPAELVRLADPMQLVSLLESTIPTVLVDAVLASPAGVVVELDAATLSRAGRPASSHGLGAADAIELARRLSPEGGAARLLIVAITIAPPAPRVGLSPEVAAAVPEAAGRVLSLIGG